MYDNEELSGVLFCCVVKGKRHLQAMSNFYTQDYALISVSNEISNSEIMSHIFSYMKDEKPKWNKIDLKFVMKSFVDNSHILTALRNNSFYAENYFMYQNWYLSLENRDFEQYYSERPSKLKNTIKRKEKKLAKEYGYEIKIFTQLGNDLDQAIQEYTNIYNKSWKNPEPFQAFTPELIKCAAELGILRLGVIYVEGNAAAAQIWITTKVKTLIYKLACDERYGKLSAGSILSRELFRVAIDEDKVKEIDYGVGSEPYKRDWMESVRELHGICALNMLTPYGIFVTTVDKAKYQLKSLKLKYSQTVQATD